MIKRLSTLIVLFIVFLSCGKEEIVLFTPENCDVLSTYSFEFDLVEEYGESFIYENISNGTIKSFLYSEQSSDYDVVNERILCTNISYASSATLVYEDPNSDDEIRLRINQSFNEDYIPIYNLRHVSGIFDGLPFDELQFIQNTDYAFFDEHFRLIYHDRTFDLLFAFDDRGENQWLKNSSSRSASSFYCRVTDNVNAYKETKESEALNALFNKSSFDYNDGFANSYSFKPESKYGYSNYIGTDDDQDCFETELEVSEIASESFDYKVGDAYLMFFNVTTEFRSPHSEEYYTLLNIRVSYLLDYAELYVIDFILNDEESYELPSYAAPFTEYVFHDSWLSKDVTFTNVYEFDYREKKLYFNFENGILAFDDHLSVTNYLQEN